MIRQGSAKPIKVTLPEVPHDISVTLCNEIQVIKHWDMNDLKTGDDGLTYYAWIGQAESRSFPEGSCTVEVRWSSGTYDGGVIHKKTISEYIESTADTDTVDTVEEPDEEDQFWYEEEIDPLS